MEENRATYTVTTVRYKTKDDICITPCPFGHQSLGIMSGRRYDVMVASHDCRHCEFFVRTKGMTQIACSNPAAKEGGDE